MRKRALELLSGVDNIELFYDLIFVYCISVITGMAHPHEGGFFDVLTYGRYLLTLLTVLQIWFYTTVLMNRYGEKSVSDYACLVINMFLIYYMASVFGGSTESEYFTFDFAWGLILLNLIVHWLIKRFRYTNIDDTDRAIINRTVAVLTIQCCLVFAAAFLQGTISRVIAIGAFLFGFAIWALGRFYRRKPSRFAHVAERCALLIIVTFGETIVTIATYIQAGSSLFYAVFVFSLVVGMFLIYNYEYDRMLDHDASTDGMAYMTVNAWLVVIVSNVTVALEFMPDTGIDFMPKSIYLTVSLVLFLLVSFMLQRFNKPMYCSSVPYAVGRLVACLAIIIAGLVTNFDPRITLVVHVLAIYGALAHEMFLFRARNTIAKAASDLGITQEAIKEAGYDVCSYNGRRKLRRDTMHKLREVAQSDNLAEALAGTAGNDAKESSASSASDS